MLWQTFIFGSSCVFLWLFLFHRINADIVCNPGNKLAMEMNKCVPCGDGQYRQQRGTYRECLNCSPCEWSSEETVPCSSTNDTQCRCREGFTLEQTGRCVCHSGSGVEMSENGYICKKCKHGTFTNTPDTECRPWRKCDQSGEEIPGNAVSDVICKNATKGEAETVVSESVTSPRLVPQTYVKATAVAWITEINSLPTTTSVYPNSKKYGLWLAPLGAILALLLIQFVIIKMKPIDCFHKNKQQIIRQDSACGKPVEESGEKLLLPFV